MKIRKFFLVIIFIIGCADKEINNKIIIENIKADTLNGGLILPGGFESLVVT